eukprot:5221000-Alexandrium_andersonii.AAC.1
MCIRDRRRAARVRVKAHTPPRSLLWAARSSAMGRREKEKGACAFRTRKNRGWPAIQRGDR